MMKYTKVLVLQKYKQTNKQINKPCNCSSHESELKLSRSFSKGAGSILVVCRRVAGRKGDSQSLKSKCCAVKGQKEGRERETGGVRYRQNKEMTSNEKNYKLAAILKGMWKLHGSLGGNNPFSVK